MNENLYGMSTGRHMSGRMPRIQDDHTRPGRTNIDVHLHGTVLRCESAQPIRIVRQNLMEQRPFECVMRGGDGHSVVINPVQVGAIEVWTS